jgi:poly(3-hydroxybutyrate) depolymerase
MKTGNRMASWQICALIGGGSFLLLLLVLNSYALWVHAHSNETLSLTFDHSDFGAIEPVEYYVVGVGPENKTFDMISDSANMKVYPLSFGEWTLSVEALNGDGQSIGEGRTTVAIHEGKPAVEIMKLTVRCSSHDSFTGMPWQAPTASYQMGKLEYYSEASGTDFYLTKPSGYDADSSTIYPLLIYLHGSGARDQLFFLSGIGLGYYGKGFTSQNLPDVASAFRRDHPCFVYVPAVTTPDDIDQNWNMSVLIDQIERIKAAFHIDTRRIYLTGFSMGGSATYLLANEYYKQKGQLFAAIVRVASNSDDKRTALADGIIAKTSIWLQVGEKDGAFGRRGYPLSLIEGAYTNLKARYGAGATETSESRWVSYGDFLSGDSTEVMRGGCTENSRILTSGSRETRKTVYVGENHIVVSFTFCDDGFAPWLFSKSIP